MADSQKGCAWYKAQASRIFGALVAAILLPLSLAACGSGDLSRSDAQEMIEVHEALAQRKTSVKTFSGALQEAENQGVLFDEGLTSDAAGEIVTWDVRQGVIQLVDPAEIAVEVTGITEPPGQEQNRRQAIFTWYYKDLPPITKRFAANGGNGEATFVLYDDGWRLDQVWLRSDGARVQLSQSELETIDKSIKSARDKANERQKYVEQSWTATEVVATISFPEYGRSVPQTITISDANVSYLDAGGRTDTIWFGQIAEITRSDRSGGVGLGLRFRNGLWLPSPNDQAVKDRIARTLESAVADWRKKYPDLTDKEILSYNGHQRR